MLHALAARLRALVFRTATDADLAEELRDHLERETARNLERGMSPAVARDAARRAMGNLTAHAELAREAWGWGWLEHLVQDVRYGVRALRKSPAFTIVAALSLALGIGANAAIFGVIYAVLLEPLPLPHPERLAVAGRARPTDSDASFGAAELEALRTAPGIVELTGTRDADNTPIEIGDQRDFVSLDLVDGTYFATTGLTVRYGRAITRDDVDGRNPVVVVAERAAERWFGAAAEAVGKTIAVHGVPFTIVGVAPRAFRGLDYPGYFTLAAPITLTRTLGLPDYERRAQPSFGLVVRLADGVSLAQGRLALDAVFQRCCVGRTPERLVLEDMRRGIGGGKDDFRGDYANVLYVLMAFVAVVLVMACANVANLLLVRSAARAREIAVRLALGASRGRLLRQLLTESALLGAVGGLAGLLVSAWGTGVLRRAIPAQMSEIAAILDWRVKPALLAFTAVVSGLCVVLFGAVPALRATRVAPMATLKAGGRAVGSDSRLGRGIVMLQMALALLLVSASALLVATLRNLASVDGGFATSNVAAVAIETRGTPYQRTGIVPLHDELLRRVRAVPGVERAGMTTYAPLFGGRNAMVRIAGRDGTSDSERMMLSAVTPGYFAAMGIRLLSGRDVAAGDGASAEPVAVVSASVAKLIAGDASPIGASIRLRADSVRTVRVVGVVGDVKLVDLRGPARPVIYVPLLQAGDWPFLELAVQSPVLSPALFRQVGAAIEASAPGVRIRVMSEMREAVSRSMLRERLAAGLAGTFGVLALTLAAVGVYGVIAYGVARRTGEIGVRMALGATSGSVIRLVARGSLRLVAVGLVAGAPLTYAAGRALRSQLFGVGATDPLVLGAAVGVLVLVAAAATAIPARRAARIDPLIALRQD
jgi:putative ABC transport system permease protein